MGRILVMNSLHKTEYDVFISLMFLAVGGTILSKHNTNARLVSAFTIQICSEYHIYSVDQIRATEQTRFLIRINTVCHLPSSVYTHLPSKMDLNRVIWKKNCYSICNSKGSGEPKPKPMLFAHVSSRPAGNYSQRTRCGPAKGHALNWACALKYWFDGKSEEHFFRETLYCRTSIPAGAQRWINVDTTWHCIDVDATLHQRHVPSELVRS